MKGDDSQDVSEWHIYVIRCVIGHPPDHQLMISFLQTGSHIRHFWLRWSSPSVLNFGPPFTILTQKTEVFNQQYFAQQEKIAQIGPFCGSCAKSP